MSLRTVSKRLLNISRDGDSTTSLSSLFQCLTTLSVKNFFLISNLNLHWHNLRPFPLVLSLANWEKRPTPSMLRPPFRTWNLVEGRSAFIKNLKQNAHIIKWSPDGERYVTVITNKVDIYQLDTASITGTITTEKRISSLIFVTDSILAIAGDDEMIRFYSCDSQKCLCEFKAHENRIKDIYSFEREGQHVIVTASSDGYIKMWNLDLNKIKDVPSLLCEVNTKARLTCLAVWLDQSSETKENSEKAETPSQANEDEKSSIVRKNKVCRTQKSDKTAKRKRKITPEKTKLEAPLQKKKKKRNSSA